MVQFLVRSLDDSMVWEFKDSNLRIHFSHESCINYSPYLGGLYSGYTGGQRCLLDEYNFQESSISASSNAWKVTDSVIYEELLIKAVDDTWTVKDTIFEILRADPLRYPSSQQSDALQAYGILYQVRNRLTKQIISKELLDNLVVLESVLASQDSISNLFYLQELIFVHIPWSLQIRPSLEMRLSLGCSHEVLTVYYLGDWTVECLTKYIANNYVLTDLQLSLFVWSSQEENILYIEPSTPVKELPEGLAKLSFFRSRLKFKYDAIPLLAKFEVALELDPKRCANEECAKISHKTSRHIEVGKSRGFIVALLDDVLYFFRRDTPLTALATGACCKQERPVFKIKNLTLWNYIKEGPGAFSLSRHSITRPQDDKVGRKKGGVKTPPCCQTKLHLTMSLEHLNNKNMDLWKKRCLLPKKLLFVQPRTAKDDGFQDDFLSPTLVSAFDDDDGTSCISYPTKYLSSYETLSVATSKIIEDLQSLLSSA